MRGLSTARKARTAILHTRMGTGGTPADNVNNHPIIAGHVTGVHNGWLDDEDDQWTMLGLHERRTARVDSEALFATLAWGLERVPSAIHEDTERTRIYGAQAEVDLLEAVGGKVAVAWYDAQYEHHTGRGAEVLHLARGNMSPLIVSTTENGSIVFASEQHAINAACRKSRLDILQSFTFEEGQYAAILDGTVVTQKSWQPPVFTWTKGSAALARTALGHGVTEPMTTPSEDTNPAFVPKGNVPSVLRRFRDRKVTVAEGIDKSGDIFNTIGYDPEEVIDDAGLLDDALSDDAFWNALDDDDEDDEDYEDYEVDMVDWLEDLMNPDVGVPQVSPYDDDDRFSAIASFIKWRADEGDEVPTDEAYNRGSTLLIGDWVTTTIGNERQVGQVAALPPSFPGGQFLIRAVVPVPKDVTSRTKSKHESILVHRYHYDLCSTPAPSAARLDGFFYNNKKVTA